MLTGAPKNSSEADDELIASLPVDPAGKLRVLHHLLGEGACRQLGIYAIPADFKLSVVIPVYNEERWDRHRRRLQHGQHAHDTQRARDRVEQHTRLLSAAQPGKRRRAP